MTAALARLVKYLRHDVQPDCPLGNCGPDCGEDVVPHRCTPDELWRNGKPACTCGLDAALAAVAQDEPHQNTPTVFPTGSMGGSTQAPVAQAGAEPSIYAGDPHRWPLWKDLTDARAAIRLLVDTNHCLCSLEYAQWKQHPAVRAALG